MLLREANKTRVQRSLADMPPSTRWYHEHKAKIAEKHRIQQREYMAKHREYYRQKSREYYLKRKEKPSGYVKPDIKPGLPKQLNKDGVMLLISAMIDQAERDIKAYEHRLTTPTKKKRLSGDDVSYKDYTTALDYLEKELPEWEEAYKYIF